VYRPISDQILWIQAVAWKRCLNTSKLDAGEQNRYKRLFRWFIKKG